MAEQIAMEVREQTGDTVVGKWRHGGIVTLVERKSGFALIGQVIHFSRAHNWGARNMGVQIRLVSNSVSDFMSVE